MSKIYTRKGDDGSTALGDRQRLPKDSLRIQACGALDELNSLLGLARAGGLDQRLETELARIQNELFLVGSGLVFPQEQSQRPPLPCIEEAQVTQLESLIDELCEKLKPLDSFILPGGCPAAATLQLARAVCRRAERALVSLARQEALGQYDLPYLNRLSDALFVMGRWQNQQKGVADTLWHPGA